MPGPFEVPRREARLRLQLPVRMLVRRELVSMLTEDVSFSGMFLRTDTPPAVRGLVRLEVDLEGRESPLEMTGMVVHVINAGGDSGRIPGVGLQLYGIGGDIKREWTRYLQALRARYPDSEARSVAVTAASAMRHEPLRRKHPRFAAVVEVHVQTIDELAKMFTRDISKGGAFLSTSESYAAGDRLFVELVHPQTQQVYGLECTVRRAVRDGVGVEFEGVNDRVLASFADFVEPPEELSYDDLLFDE